MQGELAVSRALGDAPYTRHGLTAQPEFSPWMNINNQDQALMLASDGIFETMAANSVCQIAHRAATGAGWLSGADFDACAVQPCMLACIAPWRLIVAGYCQR